MIVSQPEHVQNEAKNVAQQRNKAARNISLLFAVAAILSTIFNIVSDQNVYQTTILVVFVICSSTGFFFARAGKTTISAFFSIVPSIVLIPLFLLQTQGLSLLLAILSVTLPIGIASLTLPTKYFRPILMAAIVAGLTVTVGDYFWPFEREVTSGIASTFGTATGAGLLLAMGFFVLRSFPQFTLGTKLITVTIIVATLAVLGVAIAIGRLSQIALVERTGENLQTVAQAQALATGELLFRELTTLQTLSLNESLLTALKRQNGSYTGSEDEIIANILARDSDWSDTNRDSLLVTAVLQNQASNELLRFQSQFPENTEIFVTDQYGSLVASTTQNTSYYQANEPWWIFAYNIGFGATYFGSPEISERNNDAFIEMAVPLFETQPNSRKALVGLLHANYSLNSLEDLMVAARFGDTGQIKVHFPGSELTLNEANELEVNRNDIVPESLLLEAQLTEDGYTSVSLNEEPNFFVVELVNTLNHQPVVDELGWLVSVQQTEFETLAPIRNQQRLNVLLGTVVVLLAAGGAASVGRQLTEPITRLTAVAEKVTAGDLTQQVDIQSQDEIGILANAFNSMTVQLRESIATLEVRVRERTRALETSIEVGRRISVNLDPQQLVTEVVTEVRDAFNYYHAHIYLVDNDDPNILNMVGGTGAAGQEMLANGHKLRIGTGLVGKAASTQTAVLVPDVSQEDGWLPNDLLPDTKSETAVPISYGDTLLGVLDVQHNVVDGLQQSDVNLLQSIAAQVAIALQNANSYQRTQRQADRENRINEISSKIQSTTDLESALQVAVREVGRALDAKQTRVQLQLGQNGRNGQNKAVTNNDSPEQK